MGKFIMNKIQSLIAKHEGLRLKPYRDTVGKLSIGFGRNLDDNGISKHEAELMLVRDIESAYTDLFQFDWFANLDEVREAVIVSLVFNMGLPTFKEFENTIMFMEKGLYVAASEEMLKGSGLGGKSKWYHQVGNRAVELSEMLKTGEW